MLRVARTAAGRLSSATTPAATGHGPSVKEQRRLANGWRSARPSFCRCPITTWCSRCPQPSAPSPGRTRRKFMASCSRRRPRPCSPSPPIPSISAPASASRRPAHLGIGAHPSSACAHDRSRRRALARRRALRPLPRPAPPFLLPVRVLSRLFRRLVLEARRRSQPTAPHLAGQPRQAGAACRLRGCAADSLRWKKWFVYIKEPFAGSS